MNKVMQEVEEHFTGNLGWSIDTRTSGRYEDGVKESMILKDKEGNRFRVTVQPIKEIEKNG